MTRKILIGTGVVLGLALVATAFLFHSEYGRETFEMIRKLHGK